MHEIIVSEQVEEERTGVKRWLVLSIGLGLGFAYVLVQRAVPEFPYRNSDQIIYPLLFIVRNRISQFAIYFILMAVIILGIVRAKLKGIQLVILVGLLILLSFYLIGNFLFVPDFTHIDSARYDQNVYYLTFSKGLDPVNDMAIFFYLVYECDSLGLICTNIDTPFCETRLEAEDRRHEVSFVKESDILYVQMDGELEPVPLNSSVERPRCLIFLMTPIR